MQFVLAMAVVLAVGVFVGVQMQAGHEEGTYVLSTAQSGRIAVVNQDLGATYMDEQMYFASSVIETLSDDFVLVSRAMADTGLANGNFAAIVSFPSYFSQRITQINEVRPNPASFGYELNTNLSQRDTIITMLRIIDLEEHISQTVSFMFVASIMGELHDAQATADELLRNHQTDISAVHDFVNADIIPALMLSFMERNFPQIDHPDFLRFIEENNRVSDTLSDRYRYAMEQTRYDYRAVVDDMRGALETAHAIPGAVDQASSTFSETAGQIEILPENDDGYTRLDRLLRSVLQASEGRFEGTMQVALDAEDGLLEMIYYMEFPEEPYPIAESPTQLKEEFSELPDELRQRIEDFMVILAFATHPEPCPCLCLEPDLDPDPDPDPDPEPDSASAPDQELDLEPTFGLSNRDTNTYLNDDPSPDQDPDSALYPDLESLSPPEGYLWSYTVIDIESILANIHGADDDLDDNLESPEGCTGDETCDCKECTEDENGGTNNREGYVFSAEELEDFRYRLLGIALDLSALQRGLDREFYYDFFEEHRQEVSEEIEGQFWFVHFALAAQMMADLDGFTAAGIDLEEYLESRQSTIRSSVLSAQATASGGIMQVFADVMERLNEANQRVAIFDPTYHVNERQGELTELMLEFGRNNRYWSTLVNEAIFSRTEQVFQTISEYEEHIRDLQVDMNNVTEEAQGRLDESHDTLLSTMTDSNMHNNQLIGDFTGVLPNSRISAQGNTDLFTFVVSPVGRVEIGGGSYAAFAQMELGEVAPANRILPYIILISGLLFAAIGIVGYTIGRRKQIAKEQV